MAMEFREEELWELGEGLGVGLQDEAVEQGRMGAGIQQRVEV